MSSMIVNTWEIQDIREKSSGKLGTAELPNPEIDGKIAVFDAEGIDFQELVSQAEFDRRFEVISTRTESDALIFD